MPTVGRFMLVLHSHMPYVLSHGKSPHGTDWLNESAAECYLPILDALDRLNNQGIKPKWTVNITPILAEQLDDPSFKVGFEEYCQEKIDAAIADRATFEKEGPMWMEGLAAMWQRFYTRALVQFKHQWGRSICDGFRYFQDDGCIELITCGATHAYFPLQGSDEAIQAQVKLAVQTHSQRFGRPPRGIWLPECAYRPGYDWVQPTGENQEPWPRKSVEDFLYENGIEYFFVDSHMIRGGEPLGTYGMQFPQLAEMFERSKKLFTPPDEERSEYEHYALPNGVICFSRDPNTTAKVWSGEIGYPGDPSYLEFHKHLPPGRLRYWRITGQKEDLGTKAPYDPWSAFEKIQTHAEDFVQMVRRVLGEYQHATGNPGTLVAMYDTELFGHWWWEGTEFLYEMGRAMHEQAEIESYTGGQLIDEVPARHAIHLPEGSWGEGGYHYIWINNDNLWTWEKLYPCQQKMREMASKYDGGPAHDLVVQAARELLLAESSDWQFLISTWSARDYAEVRFQDHVDRFIQLAALADKVHAGGTLDSKERSFYEDCRQKDAAFPVIDLRMWATLDFPLPDPTPLT